MCTNNAKILKYQHKSNCRVTHLSAVLQTAVDLLVFDLLFMSRLMYFLTAQLTAMESLPRESSSLRGSPKPVVDDYNSPEKIEKRKTKRVK